MCNQTYTKHNVPDGEYIYVYPSGNGVRVRVFTGDGGKFVEFNKKHAATMVKDLPGWAKFEVIDA